MGNKQSPAKVNIDTSSVDQMTQDTLRNLEFKPVQSDRNERVESVKNAKDPWGENKFNAEEILGSIKSFHNDATANQRMKGSEEEGLWGPLTEAQKERRAGRRERRQLRESHFLIKKEYLGNLDLVEHRSLSLKEDQMNYLIDQNIV